MSTLFNDNSDSDGELKINEDYAGKYNNWRQQEELHKLKTKYGDVKGHGISSDENSDSDTSTEEEDQNEVTEQFDKDFYKTLACLKNKDPKIYNKDVKFFNDTNKVQELHIEKKQKSEEKSKKEESVFLRDYERKMIVEKEGKFNDSDEEENLKIKAKAQNGITYVAEQQQLKESFKSALHNEEGEDDTDLLKPKTKSESEKQNEDADYKEWLKGEELEIDTNEKETLKPLREFWNNPDLDVNEKFLRDYVLNNKYRDKDCSVMDLDYEQVIHDSDENLSEDEKNIQKQEEFEHKYNFRFEEPDQDFIKRYPRTMENTLRKKDTKRSQKRAEVKERKENEKLRKKEELMQLKALKRKEIEEKIEKLREITGNDDIKFSDINLDDDFDPNEHDRKMTEIFNADYYAKTDEDVKPEFPDIDEELEIERTWDNYDPSTNNAEHYGGPHCEDPDFNMDADYDGSQSTQVENLDDAKKRKRKRRSKFAELLSKEKPKFDPKQYPSYEEYFDKYYSLDYEDMIGDIPCRFKYRKVTPNNYGLSVEEILMADDKELNKWCSLKKALQYKPERMELIDVRSYQQKAKNDALKKKILRSLYTTPEEEDAEKNDDTNIPSTSNGESMETKKKRRRNKKKNKNTNLTLQATESNSKPNTSTEKHNEIQKETKEEKNVSLNDSVEKPKNKKRKQKTEKYFEQPENKKLKVQEAKEPNSLVKKSKQKSEATLSKPVADSKKKTKTKSKFEKTEKNNYKRKAQPESNTDIASLNPERLKMYGINPKKLKNKLKYGNKQ